MPSKKAPALLMAAALACVSGSAASQPAPAPASASAFRPADFPPPFKTTASRGDGVWVAVPDPEAPGEPPLAWQTVVHPDPKLAFAMATVVAMDLSRLRVAAIAGTAEPESATLPAPRRPGVVPAEHVPALFAAFNGGFKAAHGKFGMKVDGAELVPAKDDSCTIAFDKDGTPHIATWTALPERAQIKTFRQTPPCLVERGAIGAAVDVVANKLLYGLSVAGEHIIRRSALGVDAAGTTLFYAFGDAVTPRTLANAMQAVGATDAAQLDVNYMFPRFLFYVHAAAGRPPVVRVPLVGSVQFRANEYFGTPEPRDFFYVARRR